jgi:hypothetical protein
MRDLIFNEISIDFNFSDAPESEQEALRILKKFIVNCLAYSLACGARVFVREYGNTSGSSVNLSKTSLWQSKNIYSLLKTLGQKDELNDDEILYFKQMMSELSFVEVEPEYRYKEKEVFGIGKAIENESYVISLNTHDDWNLKEIENVQKVTLTHIA